MPTSYSMAAPPANELCQDIIQKYHVELDSVGVKVDILLAFRDPDSEKPSLGGIWGISKLINLKDRVKGMGDCEIILDGDACANFSKENWEALLDHQLEHFEVKRDKNGDFIFDDINRPVLKLRPHDRVIRLFHGPAARHGNSSYEAQQLRSMFLNDPGLLPFVPEEAAHEELENQAESHFSSTEKTMMVSVNGAHLEESR